MLEIPHSLPKLLHLLRGFSPFCGEGSLLDHRRRQNVVRTSVTHSATPRVPLFCSYHILTSSVIYYCTDAWQHGIYLLNRNTSGSLGEREMLWEHRRAAGECFHSFFEGFYNSIETRITCFLFVLENTATRKRKTTCQL